MSKYLKREEIVECEECGHLIYKHKAKEVKIICHIYGYDIYEYYCKKCKPPYDVINAIGLPMRYYKKNCEVNEKGKPIK